MKAERESDTGQLRDASPPAAHRGPPRRGARSAPGLAPARPSISPSRLPASRGAETGGARGLPRPLHGVPVSELASRGLPPTVNLVHGGIVLVEAFGHVETSHFRATFRLGLSSQQRGAERGQGAEQRGEAEPCHGAGRGGRAPTFGTGQKVAGGRAGSETGARERSQRVRELEELEKESRRRRRGAKSGAGPRASGNGPRCQAPGPGSRRRRNSWRRCAAQRERRRGPVTSGLRGDSDLGELVGGGTGARGRRGRWQAPRGPRRAWAAAGARGARLGLPGAGPLRWLDSARLALPSAARLCPLQLYR